MKKIIIFGILIFLLILLISAIFLFYPAIKELNIKSQIQRANYCEIGSDCIDAGSKCPFGCYNYVNKNEVNKISKILESYDSNCVYSCIACPKVACENNKCKEVCEQ
ncbi:MAG: hypothetical protein WC867_05700 [Candidatus Pacearchaeota archaeon]|jgi:hypothetical protein